MNNIKNSNMTFLQKKTVYLTPEAIPFLGLPSATELPRARPAFYSAKVCRNPQEANHEKEDL